ncbi:MAG: hypothetical protein V8S24_05445 [Gordonibacter pamelaeae]
MDIGTGKLAPWSAACRTTASTLSIPASRTRRPSSRTTPAAASAASPRAGGRAVLCGGTGLYVRAAIDAYEFPKGEQTGNPVREH